MVTPSTKKKSGVVTTLDEARHGLEDGDVVSFSEIRCMEEINAGELPVKVPSPHTFSIGNTSDFGQYERGGVVLQVKQPKVVSFKPMLIALKEMEPFLTDFAKFMTPQLLHGCYQIMHAWKASHPALPKSWSKADASEFLALAKGNHGEDVSDEEFVTQFAKLCGGELSPMCVAMG